MGENQATSIAGGDDEQRGGNQGLVISSGDTNNDGSKTPPVLGGDTWLAQYPELDPYPTANTDVVTIPPSPPYPPIEENNNNNEGMVDTETTKTTATAPDVTTTTTRTDSIMEESQPTVSSSQEQPIIQPIPTLLERIKQCDATIRHSNYRELYVAFVINGQVCVGQIHKTILKVLLDDEQQLQLQDPTRKRYFRWISSSTSTSSTNSTNDHEEEVEVVVEEDDPYTIIEYNDSMIVKPESGGGQGSGQGSGGSSSASASAAFCIDGSTNHEIELKMELITDALIRNDIISKRHGDRFAIHKDTIYTCTIDRNTAPYLGIPSIGVQLLCIVRNPNPNGSIKNQDDISLWMAQRSKTKSQFPLQWDPTVAGGQPYGIGYTQNMLKEAWEEAGIPHDYTSNHAKSVTCLSQMTSKPSGRSLKHSRYYVWELEIGDSTSNFQPLINDGEVEQFELWNSQRLEDEVRYHNNLRPAIRLVITDFLMRHGIITPDTESDYVELQIAMHQSEIKLWP